MTFCSGMFAYILNVLVHEHAIPEVLKIQKKNSYLIIGADRPMLYSRLSRTPSSKNFNGNVVNKSNASGWSFLSCFTT